jgi:hypothetical protein
MATSPEPQPPRPPAPPAPPRSSSNVLAIVLLALALIVVVSGLVVWAGLHYITRNFHVDQRESAGGKKEVSIKTPFGGINVDAGKNVSEASLGLPIYPGAQRVTDEDSASVSIGLPGEHNVRVLVGKFDTPDPLDKVETFYHDRLGGEVTKFTERNSEGKTVFEIKHKDDERAVALKSTSSGTRIELVHAGVGQAESN